jgi:hypothetical protein
LKKEILKEIKDLKEEEWKQRKEEGNGKRFLHVNINHACELQDFCMKS